MVFCSKCGSTAVPDTRTAGRQRGILILRMLKQDRQGGAEQLINAAWRLTGAVWLGINKQGSGRMVRAVHDSSCKQAPLRAKCICRMEPTQALALAIQTWLSTCMASISASTSCCICALWCAMARSRPSRSLCASGTGQALPRFTGAPWNSLVTACATWRCLHPYCAPPQAAYACAAWVWGPHTPICAPHPPWMQCGGRTYHANDANDHN